jgi:hypothetical protein
MNELQTRINSITQILASDLPKSKKAIASLQAFSGLDITHFNHKKKESVYKYLSTLNAVVARYPTIKTYDDYNIMTDVDLNKILKSIQQICLKLLID